MLPLFVQEIREALLATTAMQPLHKSLCVIFMEVQYCFLMHLHGAILKYLNRANKAEVAAMFRSKEKGAKFWEVILAKVRRFLLTADDGSLLCCFLG